MQNASTTSTALAAFQISYLAELDGRVQRSEVVGAITLKKGSAALFFDSTEGKFTLVEKMSEVEEATHIANHALAGHNGSSGCSSLRAGQRSVGGVPERAGAFCWCS